MILEKTAGRQAELLSILRREFDLSAGLVKRLKWQKALFVNDAPAHTNCRVFPGDRVRVVIEEEKVCRVFVDADQLSLAIGKEGQNARLAARLTGFKIDIKVDQ